MTAQTLKRLILSLVQDVEFNYKNIDGSICPFSRSNIVVSYGNEYFNFKDVDDLMKATFLKGERIQDVCNNITFY